MFTPNFSIEKVIWGQPQPFLDKTLRKTDLNTYVHFCAMVLIDIARLLHNPGLRCNFLIIHTRHLVFWRIDDLLQ